MAGWTTKPLGEICSITRGGSPRPIQAFLTSESDGINWVKISDATASGKYIYETAEKIKPSGVARSRIVKDGDFLLSNSMSFGRPYIMRTTGCVHDGWLVLSEYQESFNQDLLYHLLGSPQVFSQFDRLAAGSTVRNLNIELASKVIVPIPTLEEQRRIVTLLDEAFADIATAKANAEKNLHNARELLDSHIQSVFTDKSQKWPDRLLGDVFDIGSSKRIYEADWTTQGVPFFGGKEIVKLAKFGSVESASFISEDKYQEYASKYEMPKVGDILMTARGTIGVGYIVQQGDKFYYKDGNVISLRAKTPSNPQFVLFAFKTNAILDQLTLLVGTTVSHLPIEKAKMLKICLPDLAEQNFVVDHLETVERHSKKLESIYRQKLTALDDLKKSLLHQAFSGQL